MKPESVVVPIACVREMEIEHYTNDSIKTCEINVLVAENRALITKRDGMLVLFKKTLNVLTEYGQITDETSVGWLIKDIDRVLGQHGCASEWRDTPKPV